MESHLEHTQGHHYESSDLSDNSSALNPGLEGQTEGDEKKPSMFKRVKAKARKIKNSLTGHAPDHDQDLSNTQEEEEDEDEEMVEDEEIQGAPTDKGATRAGDGRAATGGTTLDTPSMVAPRKYDSPIVDPETRPFGQWQADEDQGKHLLKEDIHAPVPVPSELVDTRSGEDILHAPVPSKLADTRSGEDLHKEGENPDQVGGPNAIKEIHGGIGTTGSEVDPRGPDLRAHPSNDDIKTTDPADRGNEEAEGITPVIKLFNKMGFLEEKPKTVEIAEENPKTEHGEGLNTGSHDQFAPEPMPLESSESVPKSYNATDPQDMPEDVHDPASHDNFSPEPVPLESSESVPKRYSSTDPQDMAEDVHDQASHDQFAPEPMPIESSESVPRSYNATDPQEIPEDVHDPASHDQFVPEPMPIESSESVPRSYNATDPQEMPEDVHDPASHDQFAPEPMPIESSESVPKSYNATDPRDMPEDVHDPASHDQFAPEPMPRESSESVPKSYNATDPQDMPEDVHDPANESSSYTEKITSATAGTAQSAKNDAIVSKIGQMREPVEGSELGTAATPKASELGAETTQESSESVGQDKEVSLKEYWEEKQPGEEDRVLSSIITDSYSKSKEEKTEEVPSGGEPEESEELKPVGKVTESEEVAKRLGTEEEGSGLGNAGTGEGMVSRLTGAIGSWLGGQGGRAQSTPETTLADDNEGDMVKNPDAQVVTGEKSLQQ